MVPMMGDVNIVYINIDFLNESFYEVLLSRIVSVTNAGHELSGIASQFAMQNLRFAM